MFRLSEAVLRARTPADVTGALVHALRDGLSLGQVHLSEVSQGGEVGHATVAAPEGAPSGYVQVLEDSPEDRIRDGFVDLPSAPGIGVTLAAKRLEPFLWAQITSA